MSCSLTTKDDEVILVTGASSGIGRAICERLVGEGCRVVGVARREALLEEMERAAIPERGTFFACPADLSNRDDISGIIEFATGLGPVIGLVNVAGYAGPAPVEACTDEFVESMFATNFFAPLRLIRGILPQMRERRSGTIVNVLSVCSILAVPGLSSYCASKSALHALSESLRHEVREFGIRVVSVLPGSTKTEAWHRYRDIYDRFGRERGYESVQAMNALDRFGLRVGVEPETVARTVVRSLLSGRGSDHRVIGLDGHFFSLWAIMPGFFRRFAMMIALRVLSRLGRTPTLIDSEEAATAGEPPPKRVASFTRSTSDSSPV